MSTGTRIPAREALAAVRPLVALLNPVCTRLKVGGSLRRHLHGNVHERGAGTAFREEDTVADLDLVAAARFDEIPDPKYPLLDERIPRNLLWWTLDELVNNGEHGYRRWTLMPSWGPIKRCVGVPLADGTSFIKCEIHCVEEANFGYKLALQTGDAGWNHKLVTSRKFGGLRPETVTLEDGKVYRGDVRCEVPQERVFFTVLEIPWVPPHKRTGEAAERLREQLEVMVR